MVTWCRGQRTAQNSDLEKLQMLIRTTTENKTSVDTTFSFLYNSISLIVFQNFAKDLHLRALLGKYYLRYCLSFSWNISFPKFIFKIYSQGVKRTLSAYPTGPSFKIAHFLASFISFPLLSLQWFKHTQPFNLTSQWWHGVELRPLLKAFFCHLVIFHQVRVYYWAEWIDLYTPGKLFGRKS